MSFAKKVWKGKDFVVHYIAWLETAQWQQCCHEWRRLSTIKPSEKKKSYWSTMQYKVFGRQVALWCNLPVDHKYKEYRLKKLLAQVAEAPRPDPVYPIVHHLTDALLQEASLPQIRGGLVKYQTLLLGEAFDMAVALTRNYQEWRYVCGRWPGPFIENNTAVAHGYNHIRNLEEMSDFLAFIATEQPDSISLVYFELCALNANTPRELVQMTSVVSKCTK